MKFVFRTDASLQIGTGHVMRCITLADVLKERGNEVSFICRSHKGNLIQYINDKGYSVHSLDIELPEDESIGTPAAIGELEHKAYADWLGTTQKNDADNCRPILEEIYPDWLIVDHYALDYHWQNQLRGKYRKLMVVDDLANRRHQCDFLLDQTFGRKGEDYKSLVPQGCHLLLGSQYALLRPDFSYWREYSLNRRAVQTFKNILVTMGGVDSDNVTVQVLEGLKVCNFPKDLSITVVMGVTAQNIQAVKQLAEAMPYQTDVKINVVNMAELMANADVAIGASGATTWERCCLGLPGIQLVIADNQLSIAKALGSVGAIKYVENLTNLQSILVDTVNGCRKMSLLASSITDGRGCELVCNDLLSNATQEECIKLKPVAADDCDYVYSLQTEDARKYSRNPARPTWEEHVKWFVKTIESEDSALFLILLNQQSAGILRLDNIGGKEVEVSIIVAPDFTGRGIARKSLLHAFEMQPGRKFKAVIHKDNVVSKKVFKKLGFSKVRESGFFIEYNFMNH